MMEPSHSSQATQIIQWQTSRAWTWVVTAEADFRCVGYESSPVSVRPKRRRESSPGQGTAI